MVDHLTTVVYAILSGRYDRLVWGAVAIAAALILSRILRLFVGCAPGRICAWR